MSEPADEGAPAAPGVADEPATADPVAATEPGEPTAAASAAAEWGAPVEPAMAEPTSEPVAAELGASVEPAVAEPAPETEPSPEPMAGPIPRPEAEPMPVQAAEASKLPVVSGALGLLFLEGASAALGVFLVVGGDLVLPFVTTNTLPPARRSLELLLMFAAGAVAAGGASGAMLLRRASADRVAAISRRLAPLSLLGLLPLLFNFRLWGGRELSFLCLLATFTLAATQAVRVSFCAPPLWPGLRLGARLAPIVPRVPWTLVVVLGALAYATYFSFHTLRCHANVHTRSFDLGLEDNVMWNIVHGGHLFKGSPMFGPQGGYAGWHVPFIGYLLAGIYALHQKASTLLVLQSVLVAAAALPLYGFARRTIGAPSAALVALCYLLYPAVHGPNLYDFHYLTIAPVFLWGALWALEARRDRLAFILVPLALSVREDVAAGMAVIGAFLVFSGRRPRAGAIVAAVSGAYFVIMKFIVMPRLAQHSAFLYIYQGLLPAGENSFGGVLKTVIGNPGFVVSTLLERAKLVYVLQFLAPLAFLPLKRPIAILLLVPGFLFTLLSTGYAPTVEISFQYAMHWTMFLFIGLVVAIEWARRSDLARARAWVAVVVVGTLACSNQFGAILHHETARGGFGGYPFGRTEVDVQRGKALAELVAMVPPRATIVGSETVVPHVSNRPNAYTIRIGLYDAEYVLFSLAPTTPDERNYTSAVLRSPQYGVIATRPGFALLRRGAPQTDNQKVLTEMGFPPTVAAPVAPGPLPGKLVGPPLPVRPK